MSTQLICVLLLYFPALECLSQGSSDSQKNSLRPQSEIGHLYHRNYSTKDYNAAFQNWGGLQNQHGVMFFANNDGVLTYDGKRWSLIATPAQSNIRSMAIDNDGKVFLGALDDFGYLDRQKNGSHIYVSLLDKVNPELHGMGNIWQTHVYNNLVYFETETGLFCWNGERFQFYPWPNPGAYHMTFLWNESVFMQEEGLGLMVLKGEKFLPVPNGEFFKTTRIYNAFSLNNKVQLATRFDGIFLYDGQNIRKFQTQADSFFKENQIYCGLLLPDSSSVYGTRLGGAVIIDQKGLIKYLINNKNGLPTNIVLGVTLDSEGNIWFSLDNGLSKFEINNAISLYNTNNGLEGAINSFCRYNGRLYVSTNSGLYFLQPGSPPDDHPSFKKIPDIKMSTWQLLKFDNRMLVCSNQGFFELVGNDLRKVTDHASFSIHRYKADSNRILLAIGNNQLQSLKLHRGVWQEAGYVDDINLDNISFSETHAGKVWLCTFSQGAALLSFPEQDGPINYDKPTIQFLNQKNGLPEGSVKTTVIGGEEIFQSASEARIFRFDYRQHRFIEDPEFVKRFGLKDKGIFPIADENLSGNFFFRTSPSASTKQELILVKRTAAAFQHQRFDVSRIVDHVHVNSFQENNIMWFGGADGIARYEMSESAEPRSTFNTHLNRVLLNGDSTFFLGIGNIAQNLTFPYKSNSYRFEFTSTNFKAEELNEFQYKLEGHDDNWSEWSTENIKEYSRLWEGDYKFLIRSRNYAQQIGTTDEFSFSVAPPWFRSLYAYVIYGLLAGASVWALVRWRSRNLLQEKEALQKEVAHQTQEIRQQNIQLAEQSEELKINAEQLKALDKMKSNFFVNISHEFRTPLSLIISPLEKTIQEKGSAQIRLTELERMHRNAKRLQQLINQMLDLAKLESGGMKLNLQQSDFIYFIRVLTSSFESLAENRNIQFDIEILADSYQTTFDHEKTETVFYNLLSNAFKFTPDGSRISIQVTFDKGAQLPVSVSISDTGPGIPVDQLDKIFDRFYQVDSSSAREFEGSGIGLSLVRELIQLMKGQINVQSTVGSGTTFVVQLPLEGVERESIPKHEIRDLEMGSKVVLQEGDDTRVLLQDFVGSPDSLVLLVEDNADLRSYLRENLENTYRIEVAENGLIGFEKALEFIPDLILSDMMMPVMDGFTLCTKIRQDERTSHIPFVLLTARNTIESKLEGLELGADEYMTKPFNVREIQVRIKNLLEQRRNLRKGFSREVIIQPKNISITSVDEKFLNNVLEIMEAHLADPQFSVERFADEIGMSRKNLLRKIHALTDQSVNEFIRNFRLQRAAQLISGKAASISEIAYQVGFNNLSYFSKCFKDLFGVLPNDYEKVRGSRPASPVGGSEVPG